MRQIKENVCYVAFDPVKEEELVEAEKTNKPVQVAYKLPDGSTIEVRTSLSPSPLRFSFF